MIQEPSVGRIVHYRLPSGPRKGEIRPAIITRVWTPIDHESSPGMCNLNVFRDQSDDFLPQIADTYSTPIWTGSVLYSGEGKPGTWSWPPRS